MLLNQFNSQLSYIFGWTVHAVTSCVSLIACEFLARLQLLPAWAKCVAEMDEANMYSKSVWRF